MIILKHIDLVMIGESEDIIMETLRVLINNKTTDNISGIAKLEDNKVITSSRKDLIALSEVGCFHYNYKSLNKTDSMIIEGGRGCPYNCIYCSTNNFWHRKLRLKNAQQIIA